MKAVRRADATAPVVRNHVREAVWWLAELTIAGEEPTVAQIQARLQCSRATAYRWRQWLNDKKLRLMGRKRVSQ